MSKISLEQLEYIYKKYNKVEFISPDPLEYLYKYKENLDIEFVGFISAAFAFGRVNQILKTLDLIFTKLGAHPQKFIMNTTEAELKEIFSGFKYRFVKEDQLICTLMNMQKVYKEYGSLETCFHSCYKNDDENLAPTILRFIAKLNCGGNYLVPKANTKGACKRINLFLRWMVRDDHVDLGLWKTIPASKLIIPLDTHIANITKHFGFTKRSTADMKMAIEITNAFKLFSPTDPIKYDFSLTRFGIRDEMSIKDLKMCNKIHKSDETDIIKKTVSILQAGNIAIIPTDTVYGVAADPNIPEALEKIYKAKTRDGRKPVAFLASDIEVVEELTVLSIKAKELAKKYWPGPLTLILKMKTGEYEGFRIPDHNFTRELIRQAGGLLRVTSANLSGSPDACSVEDAISALGEHVSICIDDGQSRAGIASTVVKDDPENGLQILRKGTVII